MLHAANLIMKPYLNKVREIENALPFGLIEENLLVTEESFMSSTAEICMKRQ